MIVITWLLHMVTSHGYLFILLVTIRLYKSLVTNINKSVLCSCALDFLCEIFAHDKWVFHYKTIWQSFIF